MERRNFIKKGIVLIIGLGSITKIKSNPVYEVSSVAVVHFELDKKRLVFDRWISNQEQIEFYEKVRKRPSYQKDMNWVRSHGSPIVTRVKNKKGIILKPGMVLIPSGIREKD